MRAFKKFKMFQSQILKLEQNLYNFPVMVNKINQKNQVKGFTNEGFRNNLFNKKIFRSDSIFGQKQEILDIQYFTICLSVLWDGNYKLMPQYFSIIIVNYQVLMHFFLPEAIYGVKSTHEDSESQNRILMSSIGPHQEQYSWMDEYFNKEVLQSSQIPQVSSILEPQTTNVSLPDSQIQETPQIIDQLARYRSIFHNFQKHLLTVLKKVVHLKKRELSSLPSGYKALDLWKIFLGVRSSSKKILHVVFGVEQKQNEANLQSVALEVPELQQMLSKSSINQIQEGQSALRMVIARQLALIPRKQLEAACKMKRFQQFYAYFCSFIQEISEGTPSRRMTKKRKTHLLEIRQKHK